MRTGKVRYICKNIPVGIAKRACSGGQRGRNRGQRGHIRNRIGSSPTNQRVGPGATDQGIVAQPAIDHVVGRAADQVIGIG